VSDPPQVNEGGGKDPAIRRAQALEFRLPPG
jgi:hypothetical protein